MPGTRFWAHLASYPMHITELPPHAEADFLKALTQGANGTCPLLPHIFPLLPLGKIRRVCNLTRQKSNNLPNLYYIYIHIHIHIHRAHPG